MKPARASRSRALQLGLYLEAPLLFLAWLAWFDSGHGGSGDFAIFRRAGNAVLHGRTPYVRPTVHLLAQNDHFVYPTPFAYPFVPFALIPERVGAVLFLVVSAAAIAASLRLLGVRDWRCYGIAILGAPTFGALGVGSIGPFLLLLVALGWRFRDTPWGGVSFALAAAAKLFLWPLLVWLVVTRRMRSAASGLATLAALALLWVLTDETGFLRYPRTVLKLDEAQRWKSYSPQTLMLTLGLSPATALTLTALIAVCGIGAIAVARTDRTALSVAVAVALVASPILWLHYLVLLLVPLALHRPALSGLWALPLVLWVTPHPESLGSEWRILLALAVVGVVAAASVDRRLPELVRRAQRETTTKSAFR